MNQINVGDTSMSEVPGARYLYKRGEAAQLTRPFQGDASTLSAWLFTQQLGVTPDTDTPDFILDSIEATENGAVADAKQIFYADPLGIVFPPSSPTDPSVVSKVSWEPRSAIIGTTNVSDGTFTVNYLSPTITFRYCTSVVFNTPQFYSAANATVPETVTIMDFAGVKGTSPNDANQVWNYALLGTLSYSIGMICIGFVRDQKASVYNYMETYCLIIQPPPPMTPGTTAAPVQLSVGEDNLYVPGTYVA